MTNTNKRIFKNFKKRASKLAADRVESLGAAFLHETGLKASESMMNSRTVESDKGPQFEVWYSKRPADLDLSQTHPDISFFADVVSTLVSLAKNPDDQVFVKGCRAIADVAKDVVMKYDSQTSNLPVDDVEGNQIPSQDADVTAQPVG